MRIVHTNSSYTQSNIVGAVFTIIFVILTYNDAEKNKEVHRGRSYAKENVGYGGREVARQTNASPRKHLAEGRRHDGRQIPQEDVSVDNPGCGGWGHLHSSQRFAKNYAEADQNAHQSGLERIEKRIYILYVSYNLQSKLKFKKSF